EFRSSSHRSLDIATGVRSLMTRMENLRLKDGNNRFMVWIVSLNSRTFPKLSLLRSFKIHWDELKPDYDWINAMQGEAFVTTFLLRHPKWLEEKLGEKELCLVRIEVAIPELFEGKRKRPRADLVYRTGRKYFVVET